MPSGFPALYLPMLSLHRISRRLTSILAGFLLAASLLAQDANFQRDLAALRTEHPADLLKPDGWLSLVGTEWLQTSHTTGGGAPANQNRNAKRPAHLALPP